MKPALLTLLCATLLPVVSPAAEVYFDTVNTAKATRLHGAYMGAFGGITDVMGTGTANRIRYGVDGRGVGWVGGVDFGYKWVTPVGINLAAELELLYASQKLSGGSGSESYRSTASYFGAFANGVFQFDLETMLGEPDGSFVGMLKPYIGVGIGYGYGDQNNIAIKRAGRRERSVTDGGESGFAYQVFAGLEVQLSPEFSIYTEYKYVDIQDFGNSDIQSLDLSMWVLGVKFQY